ncbi:hypothetical protein [Tomitella gaofuii]|uniref:hypothetical protein n=1 Tax=Tomitella gaofuii TaxID=2760083 RepID=UPI0015F95448|nr:hypothetical protein [Tomitella gaofuii]
MSRPAAVGDRVTVRPGVYAHITAIRRSPIPYAELTTEHGDRITIPLSKLEV